MTLKELMKIINNEEQNELKVWVEADGELTDWRDTDEELYNNGRVIGIDFRVVDGEYGEELCIEVE